MAEQIFRQPQRHSDQQAEALSQPQELPQTQDSAQNFNVDGLLADIDSLLTQNVQGFVQGFVQKGGQ